MALPDRSAPPGENDRRNMAACSRRIGAEENTMKSRDAAQAVMPVPSGRSNAKSPAARKGNGAEAHAPLPLATRNAPRLGDAELKQLLRTMMIIRRFETRTTDLFLSGLVKGTAHSSAGQEAI